LWGACCHHETGYGLFRFEDSMQQAHRIAWRIAFGEISEGMCVLHKCDVRSCVNPEHLFLGPQRDNCKDMARKGRATKGSRKLSKAERAEIAARHRRGEPAKSVAEAYGITPGWVYVIAREELDGSPAGE
jgi:hypothetical protein